MTAANHPPEEIARLVEAETRFLQLYAAAGG